MKVAASTMAIRDTSGGNDGFVLVGWIDGLRISIGVVGVLAGGLGLGVSFEEGMGEGVGMGEAVG